MLPAGMDVLRAAESLSAPGAVFVTVPALLLLLAGSRLGRTGLPLAAFVAGVLLGQVALVLDGWPTWVGSQAEVELGFLLLAGVCGMWLELASHRAGLALVGAWWGLSAATLLGVGVPNVAALVGLMVVPWVYEVAPRACSAGVGAMVLTWSWAGLEPGFAFAASWAGGVVVQLFTGDGDALSLEQLSRTG
jgi:hypothetical protein